MILAHAGYLAGQGWDVEIRTAQINTVFNLPAGVKIIWLPTDNKTATLWLALTTCFDVDFIIADIIPLACLLAIRNRSKVIYFAQDYDESYYRFLPQRLFIRLLYFIALRLLKIRAIAVADHLTQLLQRRFSARAATASNGVEPDIFYPDPDPALVAAKGERKAVVMLSRSDSRKGFDLGCRILADVIGRVDANALEIWTVGEAADHLFKGLTHKDFGYVPPNRLRQILSSADVFLYHTRHEGFPLMALESLACGCPMAASTAVNVLTPDREALIAPVGDITAAADHLVSILTKPEVARGLNKEGLSFAKRHSLIQSSRSFAAELLRSS